MLGTVPGCRLSSVLGPPDGFRLNLLLGPTVTAIVGIIVGPKLGMEDWDWLGLLLDTFFGDPVDPREGIVLEELLIILLGIGVC